MQSLNDLNNVSNTPIYYASATEYTIVFGTNAGNISGSYMEGTTMPVSKQTPLITFNEPSRDLLIEIEFANTVSVDNVAYIGSNPRIVEYQVTANKWVIGGISSIADYDDAFNNLRIGIKYNVSTPFTFTTTVNDQLGNTRVWTTSVTVTEASFYTAPSILYVIEDTPTAFGNLNITDIYGNYTTYTVNLASNDTGVGLIAYGNNVAGNLSITDTQANLNTLLSNGNISYFPLSDIVGNSSITFSFNRNADNISTLPVTIPIVITPTGEYQIDTEIVYKFNQIYTLNHLILDTDVSASSYSQTFTQTSGNTGAFYISGIQQPGNSITITNTRNVLNGTSIGWKPAANSVSTANIAFSQSKTLVMGNTIVQAANIAIPVEAVVTNFDINRSYYTGFYTHIFANNTPALNENIYSTATIGIGSNTTIAAVATNDADAAEILANGAPTQYYWTVTGNAATIDAALKSLRLYPKKTVTGNIVLDIAISSTVDGSDFRFPLTITQYANSYFIDNPTIEIITNSTSYSPGWAKSVYGKADILLIGGGGGGGYSMGGGGSGGVVREVLNRTLSNVAYPITIGDGGSAAATNGTNYSLGFGSAGGNTTGFGYTAEGGAGGGYLNYSTNTYQFMRYSNSSGYGNATSTTWYMQGAGTTLNKVCGSSGAGAGGHGYPYMETLPYGNNIPGNGGDAKYSNISGQYHAGGGPGMAVTVTSNPTTYSNYYGYTGNVTANGIYGLGGRGGTSLTSVGTSGTKGCIIIKWHS